MTCRDVQSVGGKKYNSTLSLTSALDGSAWLTSCPERFIPGKDPVPHVSESGWAPGPG